MQLFLHNGLLTNGHCTINPCLLRIPIPTSLHELVQLVTRLHHLEGIQVVTMPGHLHLRRQLRWLQRSDHLNHSSYSITMSLNHWPHYPGQPRSIPVKHMAQPVLFLRHNHRQQQ